MTTPSNACRRSLSPSLIFTCTRTLSPGANSGMSVRLALARSFSMIRLVMTLSLVSEILKFAFLCFFARDLGKQFFLFVAQRGAIQKIGPVAQRLFQRRPAAPAAYLFVVA